MDNEALRALIEELRAAAWTIRDHTSATLHRKAADALTALLAASESSLAVEGWRPIDAWGVFVEGHVQTITFKKEVADGYAAGGLDVRQLAAPTPRKEGDS